MRGAERRDLFLNEAEAAAMGLSQRKRQKQNKASGSVHLNARSVGEPLDDIKSPEFAPQFQVSRRLTWDLQSDIPYLRQIGVDRSDSPPLERRRTGKRFRKLEISARLADAPGSSSFAPKLAANYATDSLARPRRTSVS